MCYVLSKVDVHVHVLYVCIGADKGLRSSKENINKEVPWEETNTRFPLNAMTINPSRVWPNAVVPYKIGATMSE